MSNNLCKEEQGNMLVYKLDHVDDAGNLCSELDEAGISYEPMCGCEEECETLEDEDCPNGHFIYVNKKDKEIVEDLIQKVLDGDYEPLL
jgi:hypothetical protein